MDKKWKRMEKNGQELTRVESLSADANSIQEQMQIYVKKKLDELVKSAKDNFQKAFWNFR